VIVGADLIAFRLVSVTAADNVSLADGMGDLIDSVESGRRKKSLAGYGVPPAKKRIVKLTGREIALANTLGETL